jgi:hypothetical protein
MSQVKAARPVGFSVNWLNSIIHTSEEARKYLEDSSNRIQAKYRLLAEASVNEHLKAIFADELGLSQEERGKLAVSRSAAIQAGLSPTVVRAAGLLDEPRAQPPPPAPRLDVLATLREPVVAKLMQQAAHEAAAKGILLAPKEPAKGGATWVASVARRTKLPWGCCPLFADRHVDRVAGDRDRLVAATGHDAPGGIVFAPLRIENLNLSIRDDTCGLARYEAAVTAVRPGDLHAAEVRRRDVHSPR